MTYFKFIKMKLVCFGTKIGKIETIELNFNIFKITTPIIFKSFEKVNKSKNKSTLNIV